MFTVVFKTWQEQIEHALRILQSLSNNSLKHTLAHIQLYNFTPKLFGKFCVQSLKRDSSLHSPFIRNFQIKHIFQPITAILFCITSRQKHFQFYKIFLKKAVLMALFVDLFSNILFTKYYITHDPMREELMDLS